MLLVVRALVVDALRARTLSTCCFVVRALVDSGLLLVRLLLFVSTLSTGTHHLNNVFFVLLFGHTVASHGVCAWDANFLA